MAITVPHRFAPRSYQLPLLRFFEAGGTRADCAWHRRSGKDTTALAGVTVPKMLERVGLYLHTFPTAAQGRKALWDGRNRDGMLFRDHFPPELVADVNHTEMSVTLTNGSTWQVWGTDFYDRLVGTNPVGVVYSEYALQDPRARQLLAPALRENGGWELIIGTLRGRNHAWKLLQSVKDNPAWFTSFLTVRDTRRDAPGESGLPVISEADIEADRQDGMDLDLIQQEYYLNVDLGLVGAYYSKQLEFAHAEGRVTHVPYDPNYPAETWWDLGVADSTVILFTQTVGRMVHIIDCLEVSGEGLPYFARELHNRGYTYDRYESHHAPFDIQVRELGTGKSRYEAAEELGIYFALVPKIPRIDGINAARAFFDRCRFDADKCEPLLNALANYHKEFDERTKLFRDAPAHDWSSHFADAFRYLAVGWREPMDDIPEQELKTELAFDAFSYEKGNPDLEIRPWR
jgi:phage terminase large subunit